MASLVVSQDLSLFKSKEISTMSCLLSYTTLSRNVKNKVLKMGVSVVALRNVKTTMSMDIGVYILIKPMFQILSDIHGFLEVFRVLKSAYIRKSNQFK